MLEIYRQAAEEILQEKFGVRIEIVGGRQDELGYVFSTNMGNKALSHEDMQMVHNRAYCID